MVIGDGAWNLDLFRLWLLEEVIKRIEEIPSPHSAAEWLLTDMERVRQGLGHSTTCGVCGYIFEDVLHAIKDCPIGYDNMLIQIDSLEAVKAIQESPSNGSNSTL
ncbi:hypothetical protein Gorai_006551, partial [Gossypium raimondii]|nr:hypothetical protein [Gossypium raimondii]